MYEENATEKRVQLINISVYITILKHLELCRKKVWNKKYISKELFLNSSGEYLPCYVETKDVKTYNVIEIVFLKKISGEFWLKKIMNVQIKIKNTDGKKN